MSVTLRRFLYLPLTVFYEDPEFLLIIPSLPVLFLFLGLSPVNHVTGILSNVYH